MPHWSTWSFSTALFKMNWLFIFITIVWWNVKTLTAFAQNSPTTHSYTTMCGTLKMRKIFAIIIKLENIRNKLYLVKHFSFLTVFFKNGKNTAFKHHISRINKIL